MMVKFIPKYNCDLRSWFFFVHLLSNLKTGHDESTRSIVYLVCQELHVGGNSTLPYAT